MKRKIFITSTEWFESGSLKNPIISSDSELEKLFPDFYCANYDTKLLATNPPEATEKNAVVYNDYREKYGYYDLSLLKAEILKSDTKNILINGFNQCLFDYITPLIRDTAEILYFFKCPRISDLSVLSQFSKLRCVHIFHNNSLTGLWDMTNATQLKAISFNAVTKLSDIDSLKRSFVEYIHIDGTDNSGRKKAAFFNTPDFEENPHLRCLSLDFTNCKIKKTR